MLVALVDKSTVLLASKQAWISDELAILHSVNVRHTQNTALFRTLRAPARILRHRTLSLRRAEDT